MIDLGSIAGLYEREHEQHAYCHVGDRCSMLDPAGNGAPRSWVATLTNHGALPRVRRAWHSAGASTVPYRSSTGWMMPPTLQ